MELTPHGLRAGIWSGTLTGGGSEAPTVVATHLDQAVPDVTVTAGEGGWLIRVPVPLSALSDGVQTFVLHDGAGTALGHFTLVAGETLDHDIRAEVSLLRAELDMLKRAFRRHSSQTN